VLDEMSECLDCAYDVITRWVKNELNKNFAVSVSPEPHRLLKVCVCVCVCVCVLQYVVQSVILLFLCWSAQSNPECAHDAWTGAYLVVEILYGGTRDCTQTSAGN
jgi:hypothetical protein